MGLFDIIFGHRPKEREPFAQFKMLNGYTPRFTSWQGEIYENELIRACIHARATHISKLRVELQGAARPGLQAKLKHAPNKFQTWGQFLYRLSTLLDIYNTAFIVPVFDQYGQVSGIFVPLPSNCEIVETTTQQQFLRYEFRNHEKAAVELDLCGILTKFQHHSDFFGESNHALFPLMDLIHIQNQGIEEGVRAAASYKFMAKVNNFTKAEDLKRERRRFTEENFGAEADGGLLLFPNTYTDIKQVEIKPWVADADQMKQIKDGAFEYFGMNEDVLTNKAYGDAWSAFYEGAIEPFAIQFSDVATKMLFTLREQTGGNKVIATANRLQYMSNADKLNVSAQLLDRGIMSINDVRDIWNLPPVEGGDNRIIRGEYYNADEKINEDESDGVV